MSARRFKLEVVGGPYDGLGGLYWSDNTGELVPPDAIFIGQCPGDGTCYGSRTHCIAEGGGRAHPAYWTPVEGEGARPPDTVRYDRRDVDEARRVAVYARGKAGPVERQEVGVSEREPLVTAYGEFHRPGNAVEFRRFARDYGRRVREAGGGD